jgi:hypothetical protein
VRRWSLSRVELPSSGIDDDAVVVETDADA